MIKSHDFDFFGFNKIPFKQSPKSPFMDEQREKTMESLKSFINYRGFGTLTGLPGTGKSMLLKYFSKQLQPNENKIIYIPFSNLKPTGILQHICYKMGIEPSLKQSFMLNSIQKSIIEIYPVNPILIFDQIQKISNESLETIRLLANIDFDGKNYFSIIFTGTDDFIPQLTLRINNALLQRITLYTHLSALSRENTGEYINYHINDAGVKSTLFPQESVNHIYDITNGIPRLINSISFAALENAAKQQSQIISLKHINEAETKVMPPKMENFE